MTTDHATQPLDLDAVREDLAYASCDPANARAMTAVDVARRLMAEVERLCELVGDENQPGWDGCSRAEAIRQAESFHASVMEWKRAHDERRAERDEARAEVERMRPIVLAAIAWRETEALPVHALDDQELALIAAVDDMGEVAW